MELKDRIKQIREDNGLSQRAFAERINVSSASVGLFETGARSVKDIHIAAICREFGVSQAWLRAGEGDPFVEKSTDIDNVIDTMLSGEKETTKAVFKALAKMGGKEWEAFSKFIRDVAKELEQAEQKKE